MRLAVELGSTTVEFAAAGSSAALPWLTDVGALRVVARAGRTGRSETSTLAVTIDNAGQQAARLLDIPLRRVATVYDDADEVFFAGTIQRMSVGRTVELTIDSGGAGLLLSEDFPLRSSRELGDYAEDVPLPIRYGDLSGARFPLIRLSGTEYLAADHPMEVLAVYVDDEATDAWEADLGRDDAGHTWQLVRFAAPIGTDQEVSATGRGLRDSRTGALIENPADLLEHALGVAGVEALFPDLRAQAAAAGIRLAGSIAELRSVREIVDEIAYSAGAIWTPSYARLYPASDVVGPVLELDASQAGGFDDPYADLDDSADVLRVAYDRSDASERSQHHLELAASPALFGGVAAEIELPWVRSPAAAEQIGRRVLERMAGRRYRLSLTINRHDIRPGQWVRLVDHPEWQIPGGDPLLMVLEVDVQGNAGATRVLAETMLSTPEVTVTGHSVALPDTTEGGVDVAFRNGIATFTVRDDDGRPLAGARVTLDGSEPRRTDDRGQVSFATAQGPHELLVEIAGYATQRVEFEL